MGFWGLKSFRYFPETGPCFSKAPKTFRARKAIRETKISAYSEIWIFEYVFKTLENTTTANFHDLKRFPFEDTKRFMSTEKARKVSGPLRNTPCRSQRFFLSHERAAKWRRLVAKRREREKPLVTLDLNLIFMQTPGSGSDLQARIG